MPTRIFVPCRKILETEFIPTDWAIIHIYSSDDSPLKADRENWLTLQFDDIERQAEHMGKDLILFSEDHAHQIIEFAHKVKTCPSLVVSCDAGISRSGAVGTFLCDFYGLDYPAFKQLNPHIHPNAHVLSVLRKVANYD